MQTALSIAMVELVLDIDPVFGHFTLLGYSRIPHQINLRLQRLNIERRLNKVYNQCMFNTNLKEDLLLPFERQGEMDICVGADLNF